MLATLLNIAYSDYVFMNERILMEGKLLFQIPIYCRSLEDHSKEYHKRYTLFLNRQKQIWGNEFEKLKDENPHYFELEFQKQWFSWHYTQIIVYVEIRYLEDALKAFFYKVEAIRHRPVMNKKIFKYRGKLSDVSLEIHNKRNDEIRSDINMFLEEIKKSYKRYFVDTSVIINILPMIDFSNLS